MPLFFLCRARVYPCVKGVSGLIPVEISYTPEGKFQARSGDIEFDLIRGFGPPEMLEASLGACILVLVVSFCMRHQINCKGMTITVTMETAEDPLRVGKIAALLRLPSVISEPERLAIERVSHHCFIHNTLLNPPEIDLQLESLSPVD